VDPNALAGVVAGCATAAALHPLDTLKVRLQVADGVVHAARAATLRGAAAEVWAAEGARGFYRGLAPALVGSGASWGLYFFFYEAAKRRLAGGGGGGDGAPPARLSALGHAYAAWEGGTATVLLTNPVWLVKTRMQAEGARGAGGAAPYAGLGAALRAILAADGVRGLYRGLAPALLLTSHGVVQFTAYEALKEAAPGDTARLFAYGAASKALASVVTYPYQVVKARMQQRGAAASEYDTLPATARKIAAREGPRGFYKGFAANVLRVAPQSALTLVVYERVLAAVQ